MAFSLPTDDPEAPPQDQGDVDKKTLEAFTQGAQDHSTTMDAPAQKAPPWEQYDPSDKSGMRNANVRLNDHERAMLQYVADHQGNSQSKILKNIVLPEIERLAKEAWDQQ